MTYPTFDELPFNKRPDLTPYQIHLTKNSRREDEFSAYDNLVHILETGRIWGSGKEGFVRGGKKAACFMDVPFASLKYVLTPENMKPEEPRYEPFGIVVGKASAYKRGLRPVLIYPTKRFASLEFQRRSNGASFASNGTMRDG